jgi:hypothetical protein
VDTLLDNLLKENLYNFIGEVYEFQLWPPPMIRFIAHSVEAIVLGAMVVMIPLSPWACTILSGRLQYVRQYRTTLAKSARCVKALKRMRVISRNLDRRFSADAAPLESIDGSCTHCGRCCIDRSCVFLNWNDDGSSRCSIYNNWFWKMTSCGSYPIDGASIAVYSCPTFKAIPIKVVR